jgi:hypothetical protein
MTLRRNLFCLAVIGYTTTAACLGKGGHCQGDGDSMHADFRRNDVRDLRGDARGDLRGNFKGDLRVGLMSGGGNQRVGRDRKGEGCRAPLDAVTNL